MPSEPPGIYPKYLVFHYIEGHDWSNEKFQVYARHENKDVHHVHNLDEVDDFCFVLKPIKDKHARVALAAYAESVKDEKPNLHRDIMEVLSDF